MGAFQGPTEERSTARLISTFHWICDQPRLVAALLAGRGREALERLSSRQPSEVRRVAAQRCRQRERMQLE